MYVFGLRAPLSSNIWNFPEGYLNDCSIHLAYNNEGNYYYNQKIKQIVNSIFKTKANLSGKETTNIPEKLQTQVLVSIWEQ